MAHLVWEMVSHPIQVLAFVYYFSTQLTLILLKRILLPQYPSFQSLRLQAQRAYLSAAMLNFPYLMHQLPIVATETEARKIGDKLTAYMIPGTDRLEDYTADKGDTKRVVVLFGHGGGYAVGEARMYLRYMKRWKTKALKRGIDLTFVAVEYPLSVAESHPAQVNSFVSAYRYLLDVGIPPSRVMFMGDSAGGGLTILSGVALLSLDVPQPAGTIVASPWVDMMLTAYEGGNAAIETDYVVTVNSAIYMLRKMFVGEYAPDSPEVNPLCRKPKELQGLNRQLIFVGGGEFCRYDSVQWARLLEEAQVEHRLVIEQAQMHVYALGSDWIDPVVVEKTDSFMFDWIEQATG